LKAVSPENMLDILVTLLVSHAPVTWASGWPPLLNPVAALNMLDILVTLPVLQELMS